MGVIGFLLDTFLVGPTAMRIATGWFTPGKDKQVFLVAAISCLSAWMMCPLMSFFATLFFKDSHNANFFAMWVQTTAMNYPTAFLWQLCGAGPLVRFVFGKGLAAMKRSDNNFIKHRQKNTNPICTNKTAQKPLAIFGNSAIIRLNLKIGCTYYI